MRLSKVGAFFATSVGGALAGRGADLIVFDDPLDMKDAGNEQQIQKVNQRFDSLVMSRLNDPKTGRVVIIAHRLNDNDLSAHVAQQGGWRPVVLPLVAPRKRTYNLGFDQWVRKRGELLRPGSYTPKLLNQLKATTINPDFELFYQQGRGRGQRLTIKADYFKPVDSRLMAEAAVVLSVDPGQRGGTANSYSVIQAWTQHDGEHILVDQWREQSNYDGLKTAFWHFVRRFRPTVVVIEATANGPGLSSEAKRKGSRTVVDVIPDGRSKAERLLPHVPLIRRGGLQIAADAGWAMEFIKEFVEFPAGAFDDQVDAATQYLDWATKHPAPKASPLRVLIWTCTRSVTLWARAAQRWVSRRKW